MIAIMIVPREAAAVDDVAVLVLVAAPLANQKIIQHQLVL